MKTLVIDTATRACSVALFEDDRVIAWHHEVIGRGHAERLLPFIAELPERGRADQVVVNVGPGSFTGIRVGVAAARALALAWNVRASGYGCLSLVAAMARAELAMAASIDVIMNGGHGEYFFQRFNDEGLTTAQPVSVKLEDIPAWAGVIAGEVTALTETSASVHMEILPDAGCWNLIAGCGPLPASPVYGRAPDAKPPKAIAA